MKIGKVGLGERPLLLAPMEDVTDVAFRLLCKRFGADMVYTEFLSADALIRQVAGTTRKLEIDPEERPVAIQIYGREVEPMVEAARIAEAAGPEVLDLNFGCPVKRSRKRYAPLSRPNAPYRRGGRQGCQDPRHSEDSPGLG